MTGWDGSAAPTLPCEPGRRDDQVGGGHALTGGGGQLGVGPVTRLSETNRIVSWDRPSKLLEPLVGVHEAMGLRVARLESCREIGASFGQGRLSRDQSLTGTSGCK